MSEHDDALAVITEALNPFTQTLTRMVQILERLTDRVEVLELKRIDALPPPAAPTFDHH